MPCATGILRAIGTIVFAVVLLAVMLWVIGQPNLVSLWRAEYLIGGFIALLVGAVVWASRSKMSATADAKETKETDGAAISFAKGIGVALGAVLLLLVLYVVVH